MLRPLAFALLAVTGSGCGGAVVDTPAERRWNQTEAGFAKAVAHAKANRYDKAGPLARSALADFEATGRQTDERVGQLLIILGRHAQDQRDWPAVETHLARLFADFAPPDLAALKYRLALGDAQLKQERFEAALETFDTALPLAVKIAKTPPPAQTRVTAYGGVIVTEKVKQQAPPPGTDVRIAYTLAKQGEAQLGLNQPEVAISKLEQALRIFEHVEGPLAAAPRSCLYQLGRAHRAKGDHAAAKRALDRVIESLRGNQLLTSGAAAETYGELGHVALMTQDWPTAAAHFKTAVDLGEQAWPDGKKRLAVLQAVLKTTQAKMAQPAPAEVR